jgi:hypothetical protein
MVSGPGFAGCTAGTVSYLPRARVAAESWRRHHPESPFAVLLIDGQDWARDDEPFEVVLPEELGLPSAELAVQKGIYDAYELSCALRPYLLRLLLDRGVSAAVFTDTDTCFYAPVDDLAGAAAAAGLALIPQTTRPVLGRRYFPVGQLEYGRITNGLFNPGLLAVGPTGSEFLAWWGTRLARDCLKEPEAGMLADQIWVDWAPLYFEHTIVRDPSLDVGFWNLDERELDELDGKPAVDGTPLRHFHFAGFDPRQPELLSTYFEELMAFTGRRWPPPPSSPVLSRLLPDYAERVLASGDEELRKRPYGHGLSAGGRPLGPRERTIYREAVLAAEARREDPPPNPFDASRIDEFEQLVDDPSSLRSLSPQAQRRLEDLRPPGISPSSFSRVGRRLLAATSYLLTDQSPLDPESPGRVASDRVRLEYGDG